MSLRDKVLSILQSEANNDSFGLYGGAREDSEWFKLVKKYGVKKAKEIRDSKKAPVKQCKPQKPRSQKQKEWSICVQRHGTKKAKQYYKDGICHEDIQQVEDVAVKVAQNPTPKNIKVLIQEVIDAPQALESPIVQEVINQLPSEVKEEIKQEIVKPIPAPRPKRRPVPAPRPKTLNEEYEIMLEREQNKPEPPSRMLKPRYIPPPPPRVFQDDEGQFEDVEEVMITPTKEEERQEVGDAFIDAVSKGVRSVEQEQFDLPPPPEQFLENPIEKYKQKLIEEVQLSSIKNKAKVIELINKVEGGCMGCDGMCGGEYDEYDDDFYQGGARKKSVWNDCIRKYKTAKKASKNYNKKTKTCSGLSRKSRPLTEWQKCVKQHGVALAKLYYDKKNKTCKKKRIV